MNPSILRASLAATVVGLSAPGALAQSATSASPTSPSGYVYAPSSAPHTSGYSSAPAPAEAPPSAEFENDARRTGTVLVLRSGMYQGSGSMEEHCEGSLCSGSEDQLDYEEESSLVISVDWLFNGSRHLRYGLGISLLPSMSATTSGADEELGTALSTDFVMEGVFDLSKEVALTVRGHAGIGLLIPSGELADAADSNADTCLDYEIYSESSNANCDADSGPYFTAQAGIGPGLLYNLGNVGLRVDLQLQAYIFRALEVEVADTKSSVVFTGTRSMLLAGLEF